ncbi:unnamed protein product [Lactuca virosa]|uniref:Cysteine-rich transmembrane domain-containing protein n=1 Tax=Lactuca virosa TaxID=75947 RepID=A0AAU9NDU2_9ASTR|nr:unnamed protein product [Lactuca virosa]
MSINDQHIPVAYPPPMEKQAPPPPVGYPTTDATSVPENQAPAYTETRGDGFWKGCCAAICCCCVLDACF